MGKMGIGYGSEFHLLRMLGRHREQFNASLIHQFMSDGVGCADAIEWLDSPFYPGDKTRDGEWKSVDFLPDHGGMAWKKFWPDKKAGQFNRDGVPSWDAVGKVRINGHTEWLLVEAKAHEDEFAPVQAKCGAGSTSRLAITKSLRETYEYCGENGDRWGQVEEMWLGRGYQLANRLACLRFLLEKNEPARLVYVYFIGDTYKKCPANEARWREVIDPIYGAMGLPNPHALSKRIHYLFPHVDNA